MKEKSAAAQPLFVRDRVMAPMIGVSVSYLQKDRRSPSPVVPFMRVGDLALYDPPAVIAALKERTAGGQSRRPTRKAAA